MAGRINSQNWESDFLHGYSLRDHGRCALLHMTTATSSGDIFTIVGIPLAKDALMLDADPSVDISQSASFGISTAVDLAPVFPATERRPDCRSNSRNVSGE